MNCLLFLLCVSSLTLQANGFSQYYVRPTEPVNSSCPGQPCLTLEEYNAGDYFISNHNSVFKFISGVHAISLSVSVSYSINVTFESCHECNGSLVIIVYNSSIFCGEICAAFEIYNSQNITYRDINITAVNIAHYTNGFFISACTNISLESVSILITNFHDNHNNITKLCWGCISVSLESTATASLINVNSNIGLFTITNSMKIVAKYITIGSSSFGRLRAQNANNITIHDISITGEIEIDNVQNMELKNIEWKVKNTLRTTIAGSRNIIMVFKEITAPDKVDYITSSITNNIMDITGSVVYIKDTIFTGFTSASKYERYNTLEGIIVAQDSSTVHFHNCTFSNNSIPNIAVTRADITFSGFVKFINNTAYKGPCLHLIIKGNIYFKSDSLVLFSNNHALSVGGVFYADISQQIFSLFHWDYDWKGLKFHNNSASMSGDVLYVQDLNYDNTESFNDVFKHHCEIYPNDSLSIISSEPTRVCVCDSIGHPDCFKFFLYFTVYPGETIALAAVITGQNFGTSSGSIYAQFLNKHNVTLDQYQYSQIARSAHCNQLRYTIFSPPIENNVLFLTVTEQPRVNLLPNETVETEVNIYNSAIPSSIKRDYYGIFYFPVQINITVQPCPIGFILSQPPHRCICDQVLSKIGAKCYLQTLSFVRSGMLWIGFEINDTTVIVSEECRFFLCKESETNMTVTDPDAQCNFNHSGTLCGSCQEGLSVALGSQQCLHCSNKYLLLLVPFALAGIALVFAIKTLDITVATGNMNGLVLYFNTLHTVWFVLQNPQNRNPILATIVAWTNLDLGIETCFFDGLTAYWKTWLQFLFPLYLWAISGAMILLAKYSRRITKMMGSNPVSVLATIFLLSYTKLLRNCASTMFYSTVVYPNTTKTVWAVDGSIEYLGQQHLPLFIVALCVLLFLCLPYTLLLVLGQWLYKIENRMVSHVMFRIKPIMDAYFGPLKDNHRYWAGMLLLLRAIIEISISIVPNPSIDNILLSTSILAVFLSLMAGYAKGFYHNQFVTVYEVTLLLNLAVFSLTKIYTQSTAQLIVDDVFTTAGIIQLFSLIIYRFLVLFKPLYCGHCHVNPLRKCFKRGQAEDEDDWNQFEEAVLTRENPEPEREDSEESASLDSLPTY